MNPLLKRLLQIAATGAGLSTLQHQAQKGAQSTALPDASAVNPIDVGNFANSTRRDLINVSLPQIQQPPASSGVVPTLPPQNTISTQTDARLEKAIEQIKLGNTTVDSVINSYDLTPQQFMLLGREVQA